MFIDFFNPQKYGKTIVDANKYSFLVLAAILFCSLETITLPLPRLIDNHSCLVPIMRFYFLLVRIAALFGHKKARLLVRGQADTLKQLRQENSTEVNTLDELHGCVWFHAASVGEFEQARPIIERLKKDQPDKKVVLTFFSPSGYEMRKNYEHADRVFYLPFATGKNARRFIETLQPSMAVFVKYEFWKPYLKELHRRAIPTYLISAIFRPTQLFFRPWGRPYLNWLKYFTRLYVQDQPSADLLASHGITAVTVVGDTRFDRVRMISKLTRKIPQMEVFTAQRSLTETVPPSVLVAGSTWPPDEKLIACYMSERDDVRLVLVPHEINEKHMQYIFQLFQGRYVLWSEANRHNLTQTRVLVVDQMGLLSKLYKYAQVAYIGGGFGVGIHNTIEAAVYGIPVAFGPNYHKFREAKGLVDAGAAATVKNYKQFRDTMDNMLVCHEQMGQAATTYIKSELGATDKIYKQLFPKQ